MARSDDDRIAYLAGEAADSLSAEERAELDELRGLLSAPATWEQPDPGLEDRVVAAITEEAGAPPAGAPARQPVFRRRPIFRRPAYAFSGLAAAVAAAVAIALAVSSSPAPKQFAMVVSGTSLAPGAKGSATLTKTGSGWRIDLSATGLPRRAYGRYYEAWLKNAAGVLVPIGTFNDARNVTLWAGVTPTDYPMLTVTQQQASGDPASSGERVLTGTISAKH
jgi:Anti-sigma-K factor rskA, C-terminal